MKRLVCSFVLVLVSSIALAAPNPSAWEGWKTNFEKYSVPLNEIQSGGPPKDGIPSIDDPTFKPISEVSDIADRDPVIGLEINGDARAYPLSVLMWHEIANDVVGGMPVAVTYCPLCNAAIVFDANHNGKQLDFGTTGRLRNSDLIMYDRQTESWWQQFSGEAIIGDLLGAKLKIIPSRLESFASFRKRFPEGKVLVPTNKNLRNYGRNPYVGYDTLSRPFLYSGPLPDDLPAMEHVVIVRKENASPVILRLKTLRESKRRTLDGIHFEWSEGKASALDSSDISSGREIGNVVVKDAASGKDLPYDLTFAFVAHAFHPDVKIRD